VFDVIFSPGELLNCWPITGSWHKISEFLPSHVYRYYKSALKSQIIQCCLLKTDLSELISFSWFFTFTFFLCFSENPQCRSLYGRTQTTQDSCGHRRRWWEWKWWHLMILMMMMIIADNDGKNDDDVADNDDVDCNQMIYLLTSVFC